jgi:DNA-binding NtrC family response regulator
MKTAIRVLAVDDDADLLMVLSGLLEAAGMQVTTADSGEEALEKLDDTFAVALLDLNMPGMDGIETLQRMKERVPELECIMVTARKDAHSAVRAMKAGAFDYVTKPPDADELLILIRRAAEAGRLARENAGLRAALGSADGTQRWIGSSPASKLLLKRVDQVARTGAPVLITGETGTGKSLLARMIHDLGSRAGKPFITVSCAAIPRELVESELFGHEKGAFTGAAGERPGRMEIAGTGTLFLDEIGEVPLGIQPKILRVLEEREFERVGGNETLHMEARIIAATNRNLQAMCAENEFRVDLFYRLNVLHLEVPPLRERREDIRPLAEHVLAQINQDLGTTKTLSEKAWDKVVNAEWPGNVRELQNTLERALTFAETETLDSNDLWIEKKSAAAAAPQTLANMPLEAVEKRAITETLQACNGNKAEAARRLGISEKTIYNKIKRLNIAS